MNKKVKLMILLIIFICLFFVISTVAYVTRNTKTNNIITFGSIKMELIQTTLDENGQEKNIENNENTNITYKPIVSRIVKIKNLEKQDFFARIALELKAVDVNNQEFNASELVSYNLNTEDWIYKDGWYYYKKIVKQNEITTNLITEIKFDTDYITTKYPKAKFEFNIKAEAVQAKNNAETVLDALGWPTE